MRHRVVRTCGARRRVVRASGLSVIHVLSRVLFARVVARRLRASRVPFIRVACLAARR